MNRFFSGIATLAALLLAFVSSFAAPPEVLDFDGLKFSKTGERLFLKPVRHVALAWDGRKAYPSAVFFEDGVTFLDKKSGTITGNLLPPLEEFRVTESANGKYLYAFATAKKTGSFHAVYTSKGEVIFSAEDTHPRGPLGRGLPLESVRAFAGAKAGKITITGFDGKLLAEQALLDTSNYEDGDIPLVAGDNGQRLFALANKFLFPKEGAGPTFYAFDDKLRETARGSRDYYLATGVEASPDGRYVAIHTELADGTSPVIIVDNVGQELRRFEGARAIRFSRDSKYLLQVSRGGLIEVYSTSDWQAILSLRAPSSPYTWVDFAISDNGKYAALFNGSEVALFDVKAGKIATADFPYAFSRCFLADGGRRLIFTGEFGFCVYDVASK